MRIGYILYNHYLPAGETSKTRSPALILALDIGTSTISGLLYDRTARRARAVANLANDSDVAGLPATRHEQNPERIYELCLQIQAELLRQAGLAPDAVAGVGITGQMHGVLLLAADGRLGSNLITWRDQRTREDGGEFLSGVEKLAGKAAAKKRGCGLRPGYGGATLAWLAKNGGLRPGQRALTAADYLAYRLTGQAASEATHAASWGLLDLGRRAWDMPLAKKLGLPAGLLPPLKPTGEALGPVTDRSAALFGSAAPVFPPVGDNQASFIGATEGQGGAVINLGTGGQVSLAVSEVRHAPGLETRPLPETGFILVGASLCGGWAYAYLHSFLSATLREVGGREMAKDELYRRLGELAAGAPADWGGLRVDPRFSGTREAPELRGGILNIDRNNFTPANLARAFLTGMVEELAELAERAGGEKPAAVTASGNAARRNPLLPQLISARFGAPCRVSQIDEEAALGAALQAARYVRKGE